MPYDDALFLSMLRLPWLRALKKLFMLLRFTTPACADFCFCDVICALDWFADWSGLELICCCICACIDML